MAYLVAGKSLEGDLELVGAGTVFLLRFHVGNELREALVCERLPIKRDFAF